MAEKQTTHPVYELSVDVSNTSRLYEYYMLKDYIRSTDVVLDIGCNTGTGMDILSTFSKDVYGIDVVPGLQDILTRKYKDRRGIHFKIVNEGEIPFEKNFFDAIVANNFIEHVEDPDYYLRKFKDLLKPGGTLYLTTVNRRNRLYFWQRPYNPHHYTEYSAATLIKVLSKHFPEVECKGIIKRPPFFPDYLAQAAGRRFRMGIKYPVLSFLSSVKSRLTGRRPQIPTVETVHVPSDKIATEKFNLDDFKESFTYLNVDSENKHKWIELFAICKK